jgi:3-demethoxyubiquinol 3-hydroxylase
MRNLSSIDGAIGVFSAALSVITAPPAARRPIPSPPNTPVATPLSESERRLSQRLMRVNHVGEVCAQALYQAQARGATNPALKRMLLDAAQEELDHLAWTAQRLRELGGQQSVLNPLWYGGSFGLGLIAGRLGPELSLGFVQETERQVEAHLATHLERLPKGDHESRAIVDAMRQDEAAHGAMAAAAGAKPLPLPVTAAMRLSARLMTATAHYI